MCPARPVPAELERGPFLRATGLQHASRHSLAGQSYRRITRSVHCAGHVRLDHAAMIRALRLVLPPEAVLSGRSAAWAHGLRWASGDHPVEIVLPHAHRVRSRPGRLVVSGEWLDQDETLRTDWGDATTLPRTAFDLARKLPLPEAVGAVDALLRAGGLDPGSVLAVIERHPGARHVRQAAEVARLADPRAESFQESVLRVLLLQSRLPPPVPQFEVLDGGRFVARLDLAWPEQQVGIEYDGAHHREFLQHSHDLARHNDLRSLGWTVFQVDAAQLRLIDPLVARVRAALRERSRQGGPR